MVFEGDGFEIERVLSYESRFDIDYGADWF